MLQRYINEIRDGKVNAIARGISLVENEAEGYLDLLTAIEIKSTPVVGITGPPGAGKSSLTDALIAEYISHEKKVAVLCVDPSSPFNLGAILGDRIRMSHWYNHPGVYIRSLATRGSLGGLSPKIMEVTDLLRSAPFDVIIIETVGVGQSEIEVAGLADVTIVTMVPEAGDEVQTMKAGIMEIADLFVVNKADRPGADKFVKNLAMMMEPGISGTRRQINILKTSALNREGITELYEAIQQSLQSGTTHGERQQWLRAEKAYKLIQHYLMQHIIKTELELELGKKENKNIYAVVKQYIEENKL